MGHPGSAMTMSGVLGQIIGCLRPFPVASCLLLATITFDAMVDTWLPLGLSLLVDKAIVPGDSRLFAVIGVSMVLAWMLSIGSQLGRDWLYAWLTAHVLKDFRTRLEARIHERPFREIKNLRPADLLTRFTSDLSTIENLLVNVLPSLLFALLYLVLSLGVMAVTDWRLTGLILIGLPLTTIGPALLARRASRHGNQARQTESDVAARAQETLVGQPMIRTFDLRQSFQEAFRVKVEHLFRRSLRFYHLSNLTKRMPNLFVQFLHLALMVTGGWLAFRGELGVGALLAFNLLFLNVSTAVLDLSVTLGPLLQAGLAFDRLLPELAERDPVGRNNMRPPRAPRIELTRELRLDGIRFAYGSNRAALDGVSLALPSGRRTAIVGPSGSGKSTLAALLAGLYSPEAGRILWDGEELSPANRAAFLARLGVVFQDNTVLNASLRHNILLGQPDLPRGGELERRLAACLEASGLADWIRELPDGLWTPAGEDGGFLSGGQRQRLALARALFREPALLILDEATSALDPLTERHVNDTLRRLAGSTTIIHITHRLEGIKDYDQIVVLQEGRIAETGTHGDLLAADGLYAALWNRQSGLEVDTGATSARISVEGLRNIPLFAGSLGNTLNELAHNFTSEVHEAGSRIIRQGSPGTRFFVIARGKVAVRIRKGAVEETVATLADGDFFGEMSLLDATLTSASVVATAPTVLLALEKTSFLQLMRSDATLFESVSRTARRRREQNAVRAAGGPGS